jgi:anaerobic selenocysteine-containing dehydrogenase
MGRREPALFESDEDLAASALDVDDARLPEGLLDARPGGLSESKQAALQALRERGYAKCADVSTGSGPADAGVAPYAHGGFPTPSGKVEFFSRRLLALGQDPLPQVVLPRESPATAPALATRFPLQLLSPPARHFMNSTFVNVESLQASEREPAIDLHPEDARVRGLDAGDTVEVFNDRGRFLARLRCTGRAREGVALAWGLWWHSLAPGGRGLNAVTSQALTDLGRGPTFYDCLVQVSKVSSA